MLGHVSAYLAGPYLEKRFLEKFDAASRLDLRSFLDAVDAVDGGDGMLSYSEYLEFCMQRAYGAKPEHLAQLRSTFNAVDASKNGQITRKEMLDWVRSQPQ